MGKNGKKWNMVTKHCNTEYDTGIHQRLWILNVNNSVFQTELFTNCCTLNRTIQHSNTNLQRYFVSSTGYTRTPYI